jgi:hypothetical protein
MALSLGALVLAPCMDAWALQATFLPVASQPGAAAVPVRGVWRKKSVIIDTGTGYATTTQATFGIRLSEWPNPPQKYDLITINDPIIEDDTTEVNTTWIVDDVTSDGQGGTMLSIKRKPSGMPGP